jgi:ArsR family transcriptional regulator
MTDAEQARIAKAIADPTRFRLLQEIAQRERCTCSSVKDDLGVTPATLSHHLKELEEAGLIQVTREGRFAVMRLRRDVWKTYLKELSHL